VQAASRGILGLAVLLLAASPARASLLTLTGSTLTIEFGLNAFYAGGVPITLQQSPAAIPLSVSPGGGFTEPAGIFTGSVAIPTSLFTGVPLVIDLDVRISNGTKAIAPGAVGGGHATGAGIRRAGGGLGGLGTLAGTAIFNALGLFNIDLPLAPIGSTGGMADEAAPSFFATVLGTGWTTGAVTLTGLTTETPGGANINTVTFAGYDNRTPAHRGVVQLVSPFKTMTTNTGNIASVALQTLTFEGAVPEPGTLLLLAAGIAGLTVHGLRKRRSQRRRS
jgi:hypothetical protein